MDASKKTWFSLALLNLFLSGCIGLLLRYAFVAELSWMDFRNFMHAHSHVAMLGWGYLGLFTMFFAYFFDDQNASRKYSRLFGLLMLTVMGMLITFPIFGYKPPSIIFSSANLVLSYFGAFWMWKDLTASNKPTLSIRFVKAALIFQVISTLPLWGIGPLVALDLRSSPLYYMFIQFFLHFQFNGWFVFGILGLFLKVMEDKGIYFPEKQTSSFFWFLVTSCFFTFALAVSWSNPLPVIFLINSIGVLLQAAALLLLVKIIILKRPEILPALNSWEGLLIKSAILCLGFKILVQTVVVIPYIATIAYTIRNFVLGFIHLILLGVLSMGLLGFALQKGYLKLSLSSTKIGILLFYTGFFLTEMLLFGQGMLLWAQMGFIKFYHEVVFAVSLFLPLSILFFLFSVKKNQSL